MAAGFVLQECQIGDFSNDDYTESLLMVVQRQDYFIHGQVRKESSKILNTIVDHFYSTFTVVVIVV